MSSSNFATIFESFLSDQNRDLQSLLAAAAASSPPPATPDEASARDLHLLPLISSVLSHYQNYYQAKQASASHNLLPMFSPTWTSTTENLLLWSAGWRPSTLFHLLYSQCGSQVESHLHHLIKGHITWNLADLDADQLKRIDELHRATLRREKEVSEEEAAAQEKVADEGMVRVSHAMTEMGGGAELMEVEMRGKVEAMREVLRKADCLRIQTLEAVVEILRPIQAVHFLIGAAELHLRVHEFGMKKDEEEGAKGPAS